jgi:hypothetical protein
VVGGGRVRSFGNPGRIGEENGVRKQGRGALGEQRGGKIDHEAVMGFDAVGNRARRGRDVDRMQCSKRRRNGL